MHSTAAPVYEATVSADLRRLLAGCGGRRGGPDPGPCEVSQPPQDEAPASSSDRHEPSATPWVDIALRRDGMRPLRLKGLLLHRTEVCAGDGSTRLSVYATPDGTAVAHLSYEPSGSLPVRPVFRAIPIHDPDDLHRFVGALGPEQCFAVNPASLDDSARSACELLRLPANLPGLARPDAPSRHSCEGKYP